MRVGIGLCEAVREGDEMSMVVARDPQVLGHRTHLSGQGRTDCAVSSRVCGGKGGGVTEADNLERSTRMPSSEVEGELRRVLPKETFRKMEVTLT